MINRPIIGRKYRDARSGRLGELVSSGPKVSRLRDASGTWQVPSESLAGAQRIGRTELEEPADGRAPVDGWIQTHTGRMAFPLEPTPAVIVIEDVAAALSKICRFNGHCLGQYAYSVAQHSVLVSRLCLTKPLAGLLHDAAEAYLGDIAKPVKVELDRISKGALSQIEERLLVAIGEAFLVPFEDLVCEEVRYADRVMLATEKRWLMTAEPWPWHPMAEPCELIVEPWPPAVARRCFLDRFKELT